MTDFCKSYSLSRPFGTLSCRVFVAPHCVPCVGLLRFSLSEAVENSVKYSIQAKINIKH